MKLTKQITNFAGAAAIALSASAMDAQAGNGNTPPGSGNNPTPVTGCNGNPNCGGGHTPTPPPADVIHNHGGHGGMGGVATSNSSAVSNSNAISNSGVNINTPRIVGNAPAAIAFANGQCKSGVGVSFGTFSLTGGLSYAWNDYKCVDYMTAQFLTDRGLGSGRNEIVVMGLATFNNLSVNFHRSTQQVADGYRRCGKRAMENNLVLGTDIAVNGAPCSIGPAPRRVTHHYNKKVKAPKVVHKQSYYDCVQIIQQGNACRAQNPGLAKR